MLVWLPINPFGVCLVVVIVGVWTVKETVKTYRCYQDQKESKTLKPDDLSFHFWKDTIVSLSCDVPMSMALCMVCLREYEATLTMTILTVVFILLAPVVVFCLEVVDCVLANLLDIAKLLRSKFAGASAAMEKRERGERRARRRRAGSSAQTIPLEASRVAELTV